MSTPVAVPTDADDFSICSQPDKTTITKHGKRHHVAKDSDIFVKAKAQGAKNGTIEGYASQFDLIDHQGEIVRKGAFTKTIAEQDGKIVLSAKHFAHGGDIEHAVATIVELKEDNYGLWFKANWYGDEASQVVRKKVMDLRNNDVKVFSSIGYMPIKWGWIKSEDGNQSVIELTEIALKEVTLTLNPANEGAVILEAKAKAKKDNGAGSSGTDDDPSTEEPHVTKGTAEDTTNTEDAEGSKPEGTPVVATTVAKADQHSADAKVIAARAKAALIRAKLVGMDD